MKTAIALRHVHFEDVGTLDAVLVEHGYRVQYLDATRDALDSAVHADLLIVLGGPISACDACSYPFLESESDVISQRLDSSRPLLGICLGAQLIAQALGAKIAPLDTKEIGFAPLTLTSAGEQSVLAALGDTPVLHWHGDQFEIPAHATHLASTEACAHQAFAIEQHVLALQFHLEADVETLEPWLVGHAHELGQAGINPNTLRAQAATLGNRLTTAAHAVMTAWLDQLAEKLPSC